ncbi:DUF5304 family protein [Streptomyces sp. NPDC002644]
MTKKPEKPEGHISDSDAWAEACAEDLRAERERHRERRGPADETGSPAEELRKLASAVADRLSSLQGQAQILGAAEQVVRQARAAVEPVVERNPEVFRHLAAAGSELLAAYRSAVRAQEGRWTAGEDRSTDRSAERPASGPGDRRGEDGDDGTSGGQRIDVE